MQLLNKITLATYDFHKHLTIKQLSHVASINIGKYFPRFSNFAKYETPGKYFPYFTRHRAISIT